MGCCCSEEPPPYYPPPPEPQLKPNMYDSAYKWVHRSAGQPLPPTAVSGGRDIDGAQIYVGRAFHEGDMIPAKVIPEKDVAYVAHAGQEHAKHTFEVTIYIYFVFNLIDYTKLFRTFWYRLIPDKHLFKQQVWPG